MQHDTSLNILLINQNWFADELKSFGHRVISAGWINDSFDIRFEHSCVMEELFELLPDGFVPDRLVYLDDSSPISVRGWEQNTIPCVFLSVDAHHHAEWHKHFAVAFDHLLVAQKDHVGKFSETPNRVSWFPLWAPVDLSPNSEKTIDVCFRGNLDPKLHPERALFFDSLSKLVSIDAASGPYKEAYTRAKIVMNQSVSNDLNFRVFEAMTGGALLITPKEANGLGDLFTPGEDLVTYTSGDVTEAAELIHYYLQNEEQRSAIAERGKAKVYANHSIRARARQLEEFLFPLIPCAHINKSPAMARVYLACAVHELMQIDKDFTAEKCQGARSRAKALSISAKLSLLRVEQATTQEEDIVPSALLCKSLLRELVGPQEAIELGNKIRELFPEQLSLILSSIEDLLEANKEGEALKLASTLSENPSGLILHIPQLMAELRKDLLGDITEQIRKRV